MNDQEWTTVREKQEKGKNQNRRGQYQSHHRYL
jgi:hypothetical protein